jgi:hypothetical protein
MTTHLISPANLAAHLYANPKLAALRSQSFGSSSSIPPSPASSAASLPKAPVVSAPIIVNPKCSGYFVEPVCHFISSCSTSPLSSGIDEMDGALFKRRSLVGQDYVPQQEMRGKAWKL